MINTIDDIPVYDALVTDESTGMIKISLVEDPAVQSNFLAFDKCRKVLMYAIESEEKRLVRGLVMRCDFPIYRKDRNGEYYVIYKAETIRKMAEKYLAEGRQNAINLMHEEGTDTEGVQMVQYFIKESANGINPKGFEDISDGSLFAEFHILNDEIWEAIKDGTYKGFSLEGVFELTPETEEDVVREIVDELNGLFVNNIKNQTMTRKERIMAALEKLLIKCGSITTDKGILVWDGEDDLKAEMDVFVEDAEGSRTAAEDGDYMTEDGKTIKVAGGKVAEIIDPKAEVDSTEGGESQTEGEEMKKRKACAEEEKPAEDDPLRKELDEMWEAIAKILEALNGNKGAIEEMKATLSKFAEAPKAKPASEVYKERETMSKTGIKGLDRLAQILSAK